jgi:hypothetical protein
MVAALRSRSYITLIFLVFAGLLFGGSGSTAAQEEDAPPAGEEVSEAVPADDTGDGPEPLPAGFRSIRLGLDSETVKQRLEEDSYFIYRGEPDVSMLAEPNRSLIECRGFRFIDRAFFQFYEERLYTIILRLNPEEFDYYSIYSTLIKKYGESDSLNPEQVIWENEEIRLSLERPLSVKYIELKTFSSILEEAEADETFRAVTRREFLEMF